MENAIATAVVVGVSPGISDRVIEQAALFARRIDGQLVCAFVDVGRYPVEELPDGSVRSMPMNPDIADSDPDIVPSELDAQLSRILAGSGVEWSIRILAGDTARALSALADHFDAAVIVVGTRDASMRGSLREFFNGSVAVRLAHRQHRPVLVIPVDPVIGDGPLPWEAS